MNKEYQDHRLPHILHKGDTIRAGGQLYTITGDPIGFGGSSILYPAIRSGSERLYAIKECFPSTPANSFARINGIIRPKSPEDAEAMGALMHFRDRMETERIIGQRISNTNARAIGIWETLEPSVITADGKEYTDAADGIFAVLERMDSKGMTFRQFLEDISQPSAKDHPLRTGGLPKIFTTACMMEQVLLALQRVHKAGYLFGDIQDGNVFFSDCHPEAGDIGIGNLLDFGCARELIDGKRTAPITDACFTTRGFIPPEILDPDKNDGSLTLGPEADIYSVGCLMLRCLISRFKIRAMGDSPVIGSNTIDGQEARKLGCPESIRKTLNSILKQAMAVEPENRYPSADAMLEAVRNLKRDTRPPEYLLPPAPSPSESFVEHSRDRAIAMFTKALNEKNEVLISGLGGIGKSEIAIQIARHWDSPKGAYFIHYTLPANEEREAMEETILRMPLSGYRYEPKKKGLTQEQLCREEYLERLDILREQYSGALIVIDNFDRPGYTLAQLMQEHSYGEVTSLGTKFLFTTRNSVDWAPEWEVGSLSREDLLKLMRRWCKNRKLTDEILLELIDEVDGHTLTVDLMAKTLEESWGDITPEMLLEALRSSNLAKGDYPEVDHNAIQKGQESEAIRHRELRTDRIYEHLKVLFDLTGMTGEAKTVLCCATLLPTGGMDAPMFRSCLKKEEQKALQNLVKRGWLSHAEELLKIHPIVRDVCREELKPSSECDGFLNALRGQNPDHDYDAWRIRHAAETFANAADRLEDPRGYRAHYAAILYKWLGDYKKGLAYDLKALETLIQKLPADHPDLAYPYSNLGSSYGKLGDYEKELACHLKVLSIQQKHLPKNHPDLAITYNNLGAVYGVLGNHWKEMIYYRKFLNIQLKKKILDYQLLAAFLNNMSRSLGRLGFHRYHLKFSLQALKVQEKKFSPDHPYLAFSYSNIGDSYGHAGNHEKKLEYYLKALDIREKKLPSDHPDLAVIYNKVSGAYGILGNLEKQLAYARKGLEILEKKMPRNHPALAAAYNNVSRAYGASGNLEKQLKFSLKALDIAKKKRYPNYSAMADYYDDVGNAYGRLGDYAAQLEFSLTALDIRKRTLLIGHPDLARSYCNIGSAYINLGDFEKGLVYYQKARTILEKRQPKDYCNLAQCYNNIGTAYSKMGNHETELEYYQKALDIWKKQLSTDHPRLAAFFDDVGLAYLRLGNAQEGLKHVLKALDIREKTLPEDHSDLALSYNSAGGAYSALGSHKKSIACYQKARIIWEQKLPKDHPMIALVYNNIGLEYGFLGDCEKELTYQLKAMIIRERILPKEHLDLAVSYNNVGLSYLRMGDPKKGMEFILKSLNIRENILQKDHPDLALSYHNMGGAYGDLGDYEKGLEYSRKGLAIWEKKLPNNHPNLVRSYNQIGFSYGQLGNYGMQLQYYMKVLAIQEAKLPSNHPDILKYYNNIISTYDKLGDHRKELEYFEKVLAIVETKMPKEHPTLSKGYIEAARRYHSLGDYHQEILYLQKAAEAGQTSAMNTLAKYMTDGVHCPVAYEQALYWLNKSHTVGNAVGTNNLGWMHLKGYGTPKDIGKAVEFFQQAEKTNISSNLHLARIYLGIHPDAPDFPDIDPQKALSYLLRAKELGDTDVDGLIQKAKYMTNNQSQ